METSMTHASVFSGIGGPEVAAAMMGWTNLFHCEINPFGRAVLGYWFPESKQYEDITKTDFSEWRGRVGVLTGGFPCQPFSVAGQRRGAEDDRYLWPHMHRCIDEVQPRWVVCENVGGILSMVEQGSVSQVAVEGGLFGAQDSIHRYEYRATFTLERICRDLEADGYEVQPVLVPACSVGAPHRRDRVFIVGHRNAAAPHTAQSGLEGVRRAGQDALHRPDPHASSDGQSSPLWNGGRTRQTLDEKCESLALNEHFRSCDTWDAPHAKSQRTGGLRDAGQAQGTRLRDVVFGNGCRLRCAPDELGSRWRDFPSVAPVYGGGYGFPFDVDHLTIPFPRWKNESIKAYGNAIVPQVMYELFRVIDQVEQSETINYEL